MLIDELVRLYDFLLRHRIDHRLAADAADDARREIDDFFVALVNRADGDAVYRAAIHFVDDDVLGRVDELAGEITGVRCLQRRIGQAFSRAVGRDEIFEHAQTFAEIRRNRTLDDFAGRLRHQTAHTGKLFHLLAVAASAG